MTLRDWMAESPTADVAQERWRSQWVDPTPGAWTPFRHARLCGDARVYAIEADYYFWWAHRLQSRWRELEAGLVAPVAVKPGQGRFSDLPVPGIDPARSGDGVSRRQEVDYLRQVAIACARRGLARIEMMAELFVHELGHATPNLLSTVKYHCQIPFMLEPLCAKHANPKDRFELGCFQVLYPYNVYFRLLAELGLPAVGAIRGGALDPGWFEPADDELWGGNAFSHDCLPKEVILEVWNCGVWPRRRPLRINFYTPVDCVTPHEDGSDEWFVDQDDGGTYYRTVAYFNEQPSTCSLRGLPSVFDSDWDVRREGEAEYARICDGYCEEGAERAGVGSPQ